MTPCHTCPLLWCLCENECELFFFLPRTEREKLRYSALFSSAKQKDKHRRNSSATQYFSLSVFAALLHFFFMQKHRLRVSESPSGVVELKDSYDHLSSSRKGKQFRIFAFLAYSSAFSFGSIHVQRRILASRLKL